MNQTLTDVGEMVRVELKESSYEPHCEHSQHETLPVHHEGKAEWLRMGLKLPCCGAQHPDLMLCDKFVQKFKAGRLLLFCEGCGGLTRSTEVDPTFIRLTDIAA